MGKIYVVTKGCYSDYHIVTVTTNKEVAKKIRDRFDDKEYNYNRTYIEEFEDAEVNLNKNIYGVFCNKEKNEITVRLCDEDYCYREAAHNGHWIDNCGNWHVYCMADNEEQAKKIAFDIVGMNKARSKRMTL